MAHAGTVRAALALALGDPAAALGFEVAPLSRHAPADPARRRLLGRLRQLPRGMSGEARVAGHFGEWLQGRLGPGGPVVLVTLPCPALAVTVRWEPATTLSIGGPSACVLPAETARRLLDALGLAGGRVTVAADMPAGGGAGASTAALVALARAAGARLTARRASPPPASPPRGRATR